LSVGPYAAHSLRLALLTLALDALIGLPAAWTIARGRFFGRGALLALINVPLAEPVIALALALTLAHPT
jgi:ABC-type spermidine/putrescine transport system permease subunit II